jgi:membrane glycosyltransferase
VSNKSNSTNEALRALQNAFNAAYQLAPAIVVIGIILAATVAYASLFFIEILQGFIIILIIITSVLVYYKSNNYGEATLALMAGLLAAFTVDWTWNKSLVFMTALLGFWLFILLIGSIRLAAKNEEIYLQAAIYIDINTAKETAQKLRKISDCTPTKKLGLFEKAEAIRIMAFRKISTN